MNYLQTLFGIFLFISASTVPALATTNQNNEVCGIKHNLGGGQFDHFVLPSLHVLAIGDADFVLPDYTPESVSVVICIRSEGVIPEQNDYKVVLAGYTFGIITTDGNRMVVFDTVDGQLRYQMLLGELTEDEIALMQRFLKNSRAFFTGKQ
jgi:hypothetical protein